MKEIDPNIWHRLIERRAFWLWQASYEKGMGNDQEHWFAAEEQLKRELIEGKLDPEEQLRQILLEDVLHQININRAWLDPHFDIHDRIENHLLLFPTQTGRIILPQPSQSFILSFSSLLPAIARGTRKLFDLGWREFEDLMAEILRRSGWEIKPMGYTKDGGMDIIAIRSIAPGIPIKMMVQCKRNNPGRLVGVSIVREVWSVKWEHGFHQAMIATTSHFTKGAKQKATSWNLDIRDGDAIYRWCKDIVDGHLDTR